MDQIIGELLGRAIGGLIGMAIDAATQSKRDTNGSRSSTNQQVKTPNLSVATSIRHERAVLISCNTMTFGNDCERLVNIAFQTSQSFPSIMGSYADVIDYLRKELAKQYPDDYFHIIIGENQKFGFSVDDSQQYAETEQERYRVLIFSTKQKPNIKLDTHDAESQTKFKWN